MSDSEGAVRWTAEDMWARHTMLSRTAARVIAAEAGVSVAAHLPGWSGTAADAAASALREVAGGLAECADLLDRIGAVVGAAGDDRAALSGWDPVSSTGALEDLDRSVATALDALDGRPGAVVVPAAAAASEVLDAANRRRLTEYRATLLAAREDLRRELDASVFGGLFGNADAGLAQTEDRIADLDAIEAVLTRAGRRLLYFEPGVDRAMVAVSIGDVDTASRVGVVVPGAGSTAAASLARYDDELAAVVTAASARTVDPVAGVTWMGYEAPQWNRDLIDPSRSVAGWGAAHSGATRLADAVRAVAAPGRAVTLIAHSYGTVTAAAALDRGARPDQVVLMGSPGWGHGTAVAEVFVLEATMDPVADLGWFGPDPGGLAGATHLSTAGTVGHGGYLVPGSTSADNVAAVLAGSPTTPPR